MRASMDTLTYGQQLATRRDQITSVGGEQGETIRSLRRGGILFAENAMLNLQCALEQAAGPAIVAAAAREYPQLKHGFGHVAVLLAQARPSQHQRSFQQRIRAIQRAQVVVDHAQYAQQLGVRERLVAERLSLAFSA